MKLIQLLPLVCKATLVAEAAIVVGTQPQLFLDDYLIERRDGLTRVFHPPVRRTDPVLDFPRFETTQHHTSVIYDPTQGLYRFWYTSKDRNIWHAESQDAIHWENPTFLEGIEAHLVMCGDLIDRGPGDREVLDLVHRLQGEAKKARGGVHALLGNHEVMNLVRDLRYVSRESHLAFAKEERASDRKKAWWGFRKAHASRESDESRLEAAFDKRYPPGLLWSSQGLRDGREVRKMAASALIRATSDETAQESVEGAAAAFPGGGVGRGEHSLPLRLTRQGPGSQTLTDSKAGIPARQKGSFKPRMRRSGLICI